MYTFIHVEQTPLWILPVGVGPYTNADVTWILDGAILQKNNHYANKFCKQNKGSGQLNHECLVYLGDDDIE